MDFPQGIQYKKVIFMVIGGILMVALTWLRAHLLWWPLHPLGFAIGATSPSSWAWFSIFLGWMLKSLILQYGGAKVHQKLLPLFFGFVLGGFVAAGLWMIIDAFTGMVGNRFTLG